MRILVRRVIERDVLARIHAYKSTRGMKTLMGRVITRDVLASIRADKSTRGMRILVGKGRRRDAWPVTIILELAILIESLNDASEWRSYGLAAL